MSETSPALQTLVLAAGEGRRFGGDKLLAELPGGQTVIARLCQQLRAAKCEPLCVVRAADQRLQSLLDAQQIAWISLASLPHDLSPQPMSASLQAGIRFTASASAWMVVLGDMPFVRRETFAQLRGAYTKWASQAGIEDRLILRPYWVGQSDGVSHLQSPHTLPEGAVPGHPVIFSHHFREALLSVSGDEGGRAVIQSQRQALRAVSVRDRGVITDIDYPADVTIPAD